MAFTLNPLLVLGKNKGGKQGILYNYNDNDPPSVTVTVQPEIVFFYDNEDGSIQLEPTTKALTNFNGKFHFLSAIPMLNATGSGSDYKLVVGKELSKNGPTKINCANLNLSFSKNGTETPVSTGNFVNRNCSALPANQPDKNYVFQPFQIPNLKSDYDTVEISVETGPNLGIQDDVTILIYGDNLLLAHSLIGIITNNGNSFTFSKATKGNIYIMAFIEPSPALDGNKLVVKYSTGDPDIDSSITFDEDELENEKPGPQPDLEPGSKNKGCLGFLGLW